MIVTFLIGVLLSVPTFLIAHLPTLGIPAQLDQAKDTVTDGVSHIAVIGSWVDLPILSVCAGFTFAALGVTLVIRLARIVASFLTGGGGSAA